MVLPIIHLESNKNPLEFNKKHWSAPAKALATELQYTPKFYEWPFSNEKAFIQGKISQLKNKPEELFQVVCSFFADEIEKNPKADPMKLIEKLCDIIPFEDLQAAVQRAYPDIKDVVRAANDKFLDAVHEFNRSNSHSPTVKGKVTTVINAINSVLDSLTNAFSVAELFKESNNEAQKQFRAQKIMMLLGVVSMLMSFLIPTFGPKIGGIVVGGFFLTVTAISIVHPYIRGTPARLPKAESWTYQALMGKLNVIEGREIEQKQIATLLVSSKHVNKFPVLIGASGVGKTDTLKSFTQSLKRGAFPELTKDGEKRVHYINCADLIREGSNDFFGNETNPLKTLNAEIGDHRNNIILILDELGALYKDPKHATIANLLKSLLDPNENSFKYVIGATTVKEFVRDILANDDAFARRWAPVCIRDTLDELTERVLAQICNKDASTTLIAQRSLAYIVQKANEHFKHQTCQPALSIDLLQKCLHRINSSNITETEEKVIQLNAEFALTCDMRNAGDIYGQKSPTDIQDKIIDAEKEVVKQAKIREGILADRQKFHAVRLQLLKNALHYKNLNAEKDQVQLNRFMLTNNFLIPVIRKRLIDKAESINIPVEINTALVDEVIKAELKNRRETEKMKEEQAQKAS